MTFEIWLHRDEGAAVLTSQLNCLDRRNIQARDYYLHGFIEASDYNGAQDSFVSWCRARLPGVTEETVDGERIERQWRQMMLQAV